MYTGSNYIDETSALESGFWHQYGYHEEKAFITIFNSYVCGITNSIDIYDLLDKDGIWPYINSNRHLFLKYSEDAYVRLFDISERRIPDHIRCQTG